MPELPRGTVTFLFTDVEGSTRRWERDRRAMGAAIERQLALLHQAIEAHGGVLFKTVGDAVQAAFPTAPDAVAAALEAQRALIGEPWTGAIEAVPVRMALHVGEAEPRNRDYLAPVLNRLARLLAAGHGGQVLLSEATRELVLDGLPAEAGLRDLGEHRLRDLYRPERVFQLLHPALPSEFPPLETLENRPNNLPLQPTPFVGREREVARVIHLLGCDDVRLVTLTGPAGVGKTRLALQAAAELLNAFPDGVFLVDLGVLTDSALVPSAIAAALDVREEGERSLAERLAEHLGGQSVLLVLDNVEHVLDAGPVVARLLRDCPRLKVLATGRAPLRLRGEREAAVPPLGLPDHGSTEPPERLLQYEAVRLFVARAQDARADFALDAENGPAVAEICVRLDGLPLAIELAATRVKLLPPQGLLLRLDSRLRLLTRGARDAPDRQRALRNALAWSYELLTPDEQALFRRLAVFVGGFTLEAAETVAISSGQVDVFEGLASLVDKSLLRRDDDPCNDLRFGMLETIREYGREQLITSGEVETARGRHAAYFAALAERAEVELVGAEQRRWLRRLDADEDNLRAALEWLLSQGAPGAESALRLASALWRFWDVRGRLSEGRSWLERALTAGEAAPAEARAKALNRLANLVSDLGDQARARALYEDSLTISRMTGSRAGVADTLNALALLLTSQGDYVRARELHQEGLAIRRELGDRRGVALAMDNLGLVAAAEGKYARAGDLHREALTIYEELGDLRQASHAIRDLGEAMAGQGNAAAAEPLFARSLALARELGDRFGIADALHGLGKLALDRGESGRAASLFSEALTVRREIGDRWGTAQAIAGLAEVAHAIGQPERAARLAAAAEATRAATGGRVQAGDRTRHKRVVSSVRAQLGRAAFVAASAAGRVMTEEQAVAEAIAVATSVTCPPDAGVLSAERTTRPTPMDWTVGA